MTAKWLTVLLICAFMHGAFPATFIVDANHPQASDENPGTEDKPFKTISGAVAKAKAGDRIVVRSGTYRETVIITQSGTPDAPIVLEAAQGATPIIKGSEVVKGWVHVQGAIWKKPDFIVQRRASNPRDPLFWVVDDVRQVFVKDGILLEAQPLRRVSSREKMEAGTFFMDRQERCLYVWLPDGGNPNEQTVEVANRGAWLYVFGSNIVIRGFQMRHASTLAITNWPACSLQGDNILMEDCTLSWGDFVGLGIAGKGNTVRNCLIACNGNSGIGGTGEGHTIERCRIIFNNLDRYEPNWHAGGAKLIPNFRRSRIIANEFAFNIGPGLWLDGRCDENLVAGNVCHDNEGPGIFVEISVGNVVVNNVCYANRNTLAGVFLAPDPEVWKKERRYVFVSKQKGEDTKSQRYYHAGSGRGIYISSSPRTKVLHNTVYLNEGEGICVEGPLRKDAFAGDGERISTHDCIVMNNITVLNKGTQLVVARNGRDADTYGNFSDYNLILAIGAIFAKAGWGGKDTFSLSDWQKESGWDEHSVEADPHFVAAAMGDFRLQPNSPAIGRGKFVPEVSDDFSGKKRPTTGATTIGAFEGGWLGLPQPITALLGLRPITGLIGLPMWER